MINSLKAGSLLDHRKYRVLKVLGQGGFGFTYLVLDLGLNKHRAIKEFFPKDFCDRNAVTGQVTLGTRSNAQLIERLKVKFIKEARNIANLDQHQGIVRIHSVFEENNTAYYVMDYIEGESLSSLVKRCGPMPVNMAVNYICQVGEALEYVHSHHINHLDVKPANIMVRQKDDRPILIDFGLSKQYDSEGNQTSTTPTGISHGYAPLEQYADGGVKEFSPQTDVYSLAATLYFLITGAVPPSATNLLDTPLFFPTWLPVGIQNAIRNAMASGRRNRPSTVSQFIQSLRTQFNGQDNNVILAQPRVMPVNNDSSNPRRRQPGKPTPMHSGANPNHRNKSGIEVEAKPINENKNLPKARFNISKLTKKANFLPLVFMILGIIICIIASFFAFKGSNGNNGSILKNNDTVDYYNSYSDYSAFAEDSLEQGAAAMEYDPDTSSYYY